MGCERTNLAEEEHGCACYVGGTAREQVQSPSWLISAVYWLSGIGVGSSYPERTHSHRLNSHKLGWLTKQVRYTVIIV